MKASAKKINIKDRIDRRVEQVTKTQLAAIETRVRKAVKRASANLFKAMADMEEGEAAPLVFGDNQAPPEFGLKWKPLADRTWLEKNKDLGLANNEQRFFSWWGNLQADVGKLSPTKFGLPQVNSDREGKGKLKRGALANYKITIDPFPKFSAVRGILGGPEALMFSPTERSRNFFKLMNRSNAYRRFVTRFTSWYIQKRIRRVAIAAVRGK